MKRLIYRCIQWEVKLKGKCTDVQGKEDKGFIYSRKDGADKYYRGILQLRGNAYVSVSGTGYTFIIRYFFIMSLCVGCDQDLLFISQSDHCM